MRFGPNCEVKRNSVVRRLLHSGPYLFVPGTPPGGYIGSVL